MVTLTLKDHRFTPQSVEIPAGQPVRIELINLDAASEEFDSLDLGIEKDVTPKGRVSFVVGPLTPGSTALSANCTPTPRTAPSRPSRPLEAIPMAHPRGRPRHAVRRRT
uniref:Cupredoxin domain-containing protein n=1 Tax=Phenylobacterium glaciei TaxID=2803784 RepID=A0A974P5Z8_9CAUL|nr:cupredoxin domain-containing protein [Phenylobacterium glaciei]